jgi:formate hydrogenlyase subunit 3/multisubunit Na+/H+ antiporter MnhD subunit
MFRSGGLSWKEQTALAIWGIGVFVVLRILYDVFGVDGRALAIAAVVMIFGSFYGVSMPVWRRLSAE